MRYWAWFAAKLAVAALGLGGSLKLVSRMFPPETDTLAPLGKGVSFLLCDLALMLCFLLFAGALYLIVWDQRYRCRVCLRRLRMPIETGSWSRMLQFGRPEIEYICTYGHGRLNVAEVQFSGSENPEWTPQHDMWSELAGTAGKEERPK